MKYIKNKVKTFKIYRQLIEYYCKTYHRICLEKYLHYYSNLIAGDILDAGSKNRRYDNWFTGRVTAIDIVPEKKHNVIYGDVTKLKYPAESFDSLLALEVLEYLNVSDIERAISELLRVLKTEGCGIITIPFMYREHADRTRISLNHMQEIFKCFNVSKLTLHKIGNGYTVLWDILRIKILSQRIVFKKILLFSLIIFFVFMLKLFRLNSLNDDFYSGIFIFLKK